MEQLFLVARPRDSMKEAAQKGRDRINQKFQIYGAFQPALHVTVEVIKSKTEEDLEKAKEIIRKISRQFLPFPLEMAGFEFFPPPYKAITLAIKKNNQVEILSGLIFEALREQGMIGREDFQSWKFHITIASPFGAQREWSAEEFYAACEMIKSTRLSGCCIVNQLELWRPVFDPVKMREDIFTLKKMVN